MKVPTIYEMYHPELIERKEPDLAHEKEMKIGKVKNRIALLEGRQPAKENQAIVKKLKRELKRLEG